MKITTKIVLGIAPVGIGLALLSAIFLIIGSGIADAVGVAATIISIVLGIYSIIYTYRSGEETLSVLKEIRAENDSLVSWIHDTMASDNYDIHNVESIEKRLQDRSQS